MPFFGFRFTRRETKEMWAIRGKDNTFDLGQISITKGSTDGRSSKLIKMVIHGTEDVKGT